MPESGSVTVEQQEGIVQISFSHPKANSLSAALLDELTEACRNASAQPRTRTLALQSSGSAFCGGASFEEFERLSTISEAEEFFSRIARLFLTLRSVPQWVVVRAHGKAVGGGVGLLAIADYVLGCEATAARLSEYAIGIGPYVIGPVLERRIGSAAFAAMALDCQWRDASWCLQRGLIDRLVPDQAALQTEYELLLQQLSSRAERATATLRRAAWEQTDSWEQLLYQRARISAELLIASRAGTTSGAAE